MAKKSQGLDSLNSSLNQMGGGFNLSAAGKLDQGSGFTPPALTFSGEHPNVKLPMPERSGVAPEGKYDLENDIKPRRSMKAY